MVESKPCGPASGDTITCQIDCFSQEFYTTVVETQCTGYELLKSVWNAVCPADSWEIMSSFFGIQIVQQKRDCATDLDKPSHKWFEANETLKRLLTDNHGTRSFRREKLHLGIKVESEPLIMKLRIRFYPSDPINLQHYFIRSYLFKQIREDIKQGMLIFPAKAVEMTVAALIVIYDAMNYGSNDAIAMHQKEAEAQVRQSLAEFDGSLYRQSVVCVSDALGRLSRVRTGSILYNQVPRQVDEIIASAKALLSEEARLNPMLESNYDFRVLDIVKTLDSYGVHPMHAEDVQDSSKVVYIGLNYRGVIVFKADGDRQLYKWTDVQQLSYSRKVFKIQVPISQCGYAINSSWWHKQMHKCAQGIFAVRFKCDSAGAARRLWYNATAHRIFFGFEKKVKMSKTETGDDLREVALYRSSPLRVPCLKSFSKPAVFVFRGKLYEELQAARRIASSSLELSSERICHLRESEQFVSFNQDGDNS